ncbi:MAG: Crp/Fnr family transcriptional regulator [Flavobacteriales bacterium]|nr:Crp/Fnr family transcriptional regulator [Flavobacteriales bacterium]
MIASDKKVSPAFIKAITNFSIFRSCAVRDIERRFNRAELIELFPGDVLYTGSTTPNGVYLIESGNLKIVRTIAEDKWITIKLINRRSLIGLDSLFVAGKFQETTLAIDKVRCYLLNKEAFLDLIFSNKTCYDAVIEMMNKELVAARSRIISLSQKRAKQRLAESILWLSDFFGTDDNKRIKYKIRPGELATIAGTTLGNLYKLLALFESLMFINYRYNSLQILEPKKMFQFASADLSNRLKVGVGV